jgi:hypothetical protein
MQLTLLVAEAAAPKIDDLDRVLVPRVEEDVLRLHVAVDDVLFPQDREAAEQLPGEALDALRVVALEVVRLDQLVQVHGQQLEHQAQVVPEREVPLEVDDARARLKKGRGLEIEAP